MTRKDYEVIARSINNLVGRISGESRAKVIEQMAFDLKQENSAFDTVQFYQACSVHVDY